MSLLLLAVALKAELTHAEAELTHAEHLVLWAAATAAAQAAEGGTSAAVTVPERADEWYTLKFANVWVGYAHTTLQQLTEPSLCRTTVVMDFQVSLSQDEDISWIRLELVVEESPLNASSPASIAPELGLHDGVSLVDVEFRVDNYVGRFIAHLNETDVVVNASFDGLGEYVDTPANQQDVEQDRVDLAFFLRDEHERFLVCVGRK